MRVMMTEGSFYIRVFLHGSLRILDFYTRQTRLCTVCEYQIGNLLFIRI